MNLISPTEYVVLYPHMDTDAATANEDNRIRFYIDAEYEGQKINLERNSRKFIDAVLVESFGRPFNRMIADIPHGRYRWGRACPQVKREELYHNAVNVILYYPGRGPVLESTTLRHNLSVRHLAIMVTLVEYLLDNIDNSYAPKELLSHEVIHWLETGMRGLLAVGTICKMDHVTANTDIWGTVCLQVENLQCYFGTHEGKLTVSYDEIAYNYIEANYGARFIHGIAVTKG